MSMQSGIEGSNPSSGESPTNRAAAENSGGCGPSREPESGASSRDEAELGAYSRFVADSLLEEGVTCELVSGNPNFNVRKKEK